MSENEKTERASTEPAENAALFGEAPSPGYTRRARRPAVTVGPSAPAPSERKAPASHSADQSSDASADTSDAPAAKPEAPAAPAPDAGTGEPAAPSAPADAPKQQGAKGQAGQNGKASQKAANKQSSNKQNSNGANGANNGQRRQRRQHSGPGRNEAAVPQTTLEDLQQLKVTELRAKAEELGVDTAGLKKAELVEKVFEASVKAEGFINVEGILDILADGYGFLRTQGYLPSETDAYVGLSTIRRNNLRKGDYVTGQVRPPRENEKYAAVQKVLSVNGIKAESSEKRVRFADLTPVYPDERLWMEHGRNTITARVIDLAAPIGKGQRGLIVSPPKAGKTTILKDIAASISANNPEVHLMCLLVDERPEEVTDMERSIKGEVISSTFDMPSENHIAVAELVIERAKRLVESGKDVVILLDSLTRLARAYNLAQPASGRILSGGVDSTALYPPKRFLGAARNIEGGGSLTILASALIDTGSKMDEVIFEEFKGTGNMELKLDRNLSDRRIFPAIDPVASGTRREDLLLDPQEAPLIWAVRRILANLNNPERAMDMLIKSLKQTNNNQEFLIKTAKKAQQSKSTENFEF
ncbi:MAG: transcription termination factor Rho [Eggerthellaceae bacterium]|nr:transcription termination factor Rho [Eggerthellaceae bacterium]